jgi:protein-L-isoaspartate(D-aspartate) O-methyltransferase
LGTIVHEPRQRYAEDIASSPGVDDARVVEAFGAVSRERFVGPGPWMIWQQGDYVQTPSADPALLYGDVVVALVPDKRINNGQPSLHARCISAARIRPGERVLHIGCGTGYYSAILSELVGSAGAVVAWDVEPELAASAQRNLRPWINTSVSLRNGTAMPIPESDVIYVCAGCTRPMRSWVEALSDGGRLLFPLTPGWELGGMLMITRETNEYRAKFICKCSFIPFVGGSNPESETALRRSFAAQGMERVSALHFGEEPGNGDAWVAGDDWWLSTSSVRQ